MKQMAWLILSLGMVANVGLAADCKDAGSTAEIIQCVVVELNKTDRELNSVYVKLLSILDAEGQRKLKESQRAWIKYRDLNAQFLADSFRGGSAESILLVDAKTTMTQTRTKELLNEYERRK
jgi:uncharacterized protein YecT (DUF1311 family)